MFNRYIITFDNSQEGIPVLVVGQEDNWFYGLSSSPSMKIVKTITGNRAVLLWKELTEKAKEQEDELNSRSFKENTENLSSTYM